MKLNPSKRIRMFENPLLERFSYVHPAVPISFWLPVIALMMFLSGRAIGGVLALLIAAAGFFFWTFAEYILHRFVFHLEIDSPLGRRIHFLIHGIHHEDPNDQRRILMPLAPAIIIAIPFYFGFHAVMSPAAAKAFFGGFLVGYLGYDYSHFAFHYVRPKPGTWIYRMKEYHMKHHFVTSDKRFGVSVPFWDSVFGTSVKTAPGTSGTEA